MDFGNADNPHCWVPKALNSPPKKVSKHPPRLFKKFQIFRSKLLAWYKEGKRNFPWRENPTPYEALISEFFLQKTQSQQVIDIYRKFTEKYPTLKDLEKASETEMARIMWGLGLTKKARYLHSLVRETTSAYNGILPSDAISLLKLPGIGKYTASAIQCFAFGKRVPILDANVARVLERVFSISTHKKRADLDPRIWKFLEKLLPSRRYKEFNYALLDFESALCKPKNPACKICPLRTICDYYSSSWVKSNEAR